MNTTDLGPRIFTHHPLTPGAILPLDIGPARHLQVIRRRVGEALRLFNGNGAEYAAEITAIGRKGVAVTVGQCCREEPPPTLAIHLLLGVSRSERMELAIQKAVELGVDRITAVWTRRVQIPLKGPREAKRIDHWRGMVASACEQSGRCRLPPLETATNLDSALALCDIKAPRWLLDPQGDQALTAQPPPLGALTLLVGPEGGLAPQEQALATRAGFLTLRLGPRVLRTETAPLAALAAIQALWGDWRPD
ncbi:Ribosomal RNA small subunit methyltransferase E [Gammaproteobacteria bacterium]